MFLVWLMCVKTSVRSVESLWNDINFMSDSFVSHVMRGLYVATYVDSDSQAKNRHADHLYVSSDYVK